MKTTGIFGGSFAPFHRGHLALATSVIRQRLAEEVWVLPCRRNPLKSEVDLPDIKRLQLIEKAIEYAESRNPELKGKIRISDIELQMPEPSYTIDTMKALEARYPDHRFRLIIGGDSLENFDRWKESDRLMADYTPIVYPRPGFKVSEAENVTVIENEPAFGVSSSEIRETLRRGVLPLEEMPWLRPDDDILEYYKKD